MLVKKTLNWPDHRQYLPGIGQLPTHQHHQAKAKKQKDQTADSILDSDDFVVGRKNVFTPPTELVVFVFPGVSVRIVMRFETGGSVHSRKSYPFNIERESLIAKSEFNSFACRAVAVCEGGSILRWP